MKNSSIRFISLVGSFVGLLCLLASLGPPAAAAPAESYSEILRAGHTDNPPAPIPPPAVFTQRASDVPRTATITVIYTGNWTAEAQNAFEFAVSIWETLLTSAVPIEIEAAWEPLGDGVLGGARAANDFRNFPGATQPNTWHQIALANSLAGSDLDPGRPDIEIAINSAFDDWYFGTDANPPFEKYDLASVALHELGHGLGFAGDFGVGAFNFCAPNAGCYPFGDPRIYDRFAENGAGQNLINTFPNNSPQMAEQLTGNNLYFNGPNTLNANNNQRARLYAPDFWFQGSSYSHLDEDTYLPGNINGLMTPILDNGEAIHNPGPIMLGMFADLGWATTLQSAPVIDFLPDHLLEVNESRDNATDLWAYVYDVQTPSNALTYQIVNVTDPQAGLTLDGNRYVDINPAPGWIGRSTVTVRATDPDGMSTTATFEVQVIQQLESLYLPLIRR